MTWRASLVLAALMLALSLIGCGETSGTGGSGGTAGSVGAGGDGGSGGEAGSGGFAGGGDPCDGVVCRDTECRSGGPCNPDDGTCTYAMVAQDGTACSEGECLGGVCGRIGAFACTEQGIRDAIAEVGGPHYFACDGPTAVVLAEEIVIDNDVILDGEGELILDGSATPEFDAVRVESEASVELRAIRVVAEPPLRGWIHSSGSLTLVDSTIKEVSNYGGTLTLIDTEVRGMGVLNSLGVATLTRVRISAPWLTGVENSGGTMTVKDSTISGSGTGFYAGGVYNSYSSLPVGDGVTEAILVIENTTISGNTGRNAGAIYNNINSTMTLTNSTVSGNTAECGPNIYNVGTMTVSSSTVSGGTVLYECVSFNGARIGYSIHNEGTLTMTNSTVTANTLAGLDNRGEATVTNSVIDGACVQLGDDAAMVSGGHNIIGTDACGFDPDGTDQVNVSAEDLNLGPLAENGGPTMTHKPGDGGLGEGSAAINAIPGDACEVTTDQRGRPRPETDGTMCDVGSVEVQP